MTPDLQYRNADLDDVDAVVALVERAYRGEASRRGWTTEADLLGGQRIDATMARDLIAGPGTVLLATDAAGTPVACVHLRDEGGRTSYFGLFAVEPARQGRGIGGAVLAHAASIVRRRWNARRIRMTVLRQRTDLIAFYERHGFHATGRREPFPYGDDRFGRPKVDDLEFMELVRDL